MSAPGRAPRLGAARRIDLHTHSSVSDGTDAPHELVANAGAAGLDVVAITDHDTTDGWQAAADAGRTVGVEVVPGIEVSTRFAGDSVHVLAYWPDAEHPGLSRTLHDIRHARGRRLPELIARLRGLGLDIDIAQVQAMAGGATSLGRPHVADVLVAKGLAPDRRAAFDRWLGWGRPGYVPKQGEPETPDVIACIVDAGGVAVLAHPWGRTRHPSVTAEVLESWRAAGLSGIEVDHADHDDQTRKTLRGIAGDLSLVVTGSSDYHGLGKQDHPLGCNTTAPSAFEALKAARGAGPGPTSGGGSSGGRRGGPSHDAGGGG